MNNNIITKLLYLLESKGSNIQYGNENVTQLEHALQCAELAEINNLSKEIITAALLHDIGHLLYDGEDPIQEGQDGYHENLGADFLSSCYGEEVTRPIRFHVACKRYLSAVEDGYYEILSEASKISLEAQGGIFTKEEADVFIQKPFMKAAVELRRLDDQAKILNKKTPTLEHFRHYLEESLST